MTSINCSEIKKKSKKISVIKYEDMDVEVKNKSGLEMIGKGRQGAVFKINDQFCMKIYGEIEDCEREYYALSLGKKTQLLPKVHCKGKNFVVMDMVYGVDLREYLQVNPLTKELSYKLIEMLLVFKEIGYERIDHHKRQIYLQHDGSLKVIDVGRTVWRNRTYPYPRKLLMSLGEDYKAVFLSHVKEAAPELYNEWQHYMQMEKVSRQLYDKISSEKYTDSKSLRKKTKKSLTTNDTAKHYAQLENLVRKVVKEEKNRELEKQNEMKTLKEKAKKIK
jgi:predicted Ser/Thr protein kinase